ncbi:hypothetical protein GJ496_006937 [Pomphorhynchus laevis]|nr:hypothetical protein GJ496_006937 [Pomphorhynchus laevis]
MRANYCSRNVMCNVLILSLIISVNFNFAVADKSNQQILNDLNCSNCDVINCSVTGSSLATTGAVGSSIKLYNKRGSQTFVFSIHLDDIRCRNFTVHELSNLHNLCLTFLLDDNRLANFTSLTNPIKLNTFVESNTINIHSVVQLETFSIGRTYLDALLTNCKNDNVIDQEDSSKSIKLLMCRERLIISSPHRKIDRIFNFIVFILVILVSLLMGALLDMGLVIKQIRKPLALFIGFCAQYILMPLIAYLITVIFKYPIVQGIGLFVVGCCPGGSSSNQWTVLFDGDIDLSAVMTLVSTVSSIVLMPAWLASLGTVYTRHLLSLHIPYWMLIRNLLMVILPYAAGILLSYCEPKVKLVVLRMVKPLVVFLIVFFTGVGTYVHLHLFKMLKLQHAFTAPLLPWVGFTLGYALTIIFRLPDKQRRTISIETGFQNVGIAMLIIQNNFPPPENEIAGVIVLITSILSSLPMWIAYLLRWIWVRYFKKERKTSEDIRNEEIIKFIRDAK